MHACRTFLLNVCIKSAGPIQIQYFNLTRSSVTLHSKELVAAIPCARMAQSSGTLWNTDVPTEMLSDPVRRTSAVLAPYRW